MSEHDFRQLQIENEYRSYHLDLVKDFYIPVLSMSTSYKRAAGFFSSSSLLEVSDGITGLVKNQGAIQLVTSPYLSSDDFGAMQVGYIERHKVLETLIGQLNEHENYFEKERLNLLAHLVRDGILDIRIAFTKNPSGFGLYHEKMAIFEDNAGNQIAFSGSLNESLSAYKLNYETIDVFSSWKSQDQLQRVLS